MDDLTNWLLGSYTFLLGILIAINLWLRNYYDQRANKNSEDIIKLKTSLDFDQKVKRINKNLKLKQKNYEISMEKRYKETEEKLIEINKSMLSKIKPSVDHESLQKFQTWQETIDKELINLKNDLKSETESTFTDIGPILLDEAQKKVNEQKKYVYKRRFNKKAFEKALKKEKERRKYLKEKQ